MSKCPEIRYYGGYYSTLLYINVSLYVNDFNAVQHTCISRHGGLVCSVVPSDLQNRGFISCLGCVRREFECSSHAW